MRPSHFVDNIDRLVAVLKRTREREERIAAAQHQISRLKFAPTQSRIRPNAAYGHLLHQDHREQA